MCCWSNPLIWYKFCQCSKLLPVRQPEAGNFGGGLGNFFKLFFNLMFMIWDSRQQDWQLFWLSFEHWFCAIYHDIFRHKTKRLWMGVLSRNLEILGVNDYLICTANNLNDNSGKILKSTESCQFVEILEDLRHYLFLSYLSSHSSITENHFLISENRH